LVSDHDAKETLEAAEQLRHRVEDWLRERHPDLLPQPD
jgi:hypothetical protein